MKNIALKYALAGSLVAYAATDVVGPGKGHNRISAAGRIGLAHDMAHKADDNEHLAAFMEEVAKANETLATSPVLLYSYFNEVFGDDLKAFPISGTQDIDATKPFYVESNPDISERPTKRKNGGGTAQYSWIDEFADTLSQARQWAERIAWFSEKDKGIAEVGEEQAEMEVGKYKGRMNRLRAKVRQAIELYQQMEKAAEYEGAKAEFIYRWFNVPELDGNGKPVIDDDGKPVFKRHESGKNKGKIVRESEIADTAECIMVRDTEPGTNLYVRYTVQGFLNLDFDAAIEAGGTYQDLIKTAGRGAGGEEEEDTFVITKKEHAESAFAALASWLEKSGNFASLQKELGKDGDEADHYLRTIEKVWERAAALIAPHSKRLENIEAREKQAAA